MCPDPTITEIKEAIALAEKLAPDSKNRFVNYALVARKFELDSKDLLKKQVKAIMGIDYLEENPKGEL
jgi:hypothetical protein